MSLQCLSGVDLFGESEVLGVLEVIFVEVEIGSFDLIRMLMLIKYEVRWQVPSLTL